uniref:Bm7893 n=1 Tax=Brugia malayi TaxID=6279 RepID=A0A0H5S0X7_BRUMA|nr:Bm7893 [Brugia malayi]
MDAPPAPPPPPPLQSTSSLLSSSWRSSTDSNRQAHSTVSASPKPTTPRLDAKTLQHAVAGLRKTEYGRSLQGDIENLSNGRLDGTDQQLSGRYRSNGSFDVPLERNKAGTAFYASSNDTRDPMPVGNVHRHSDSLNNTPYTERSSFQQQSQTMPFSSYHSYQQQSQTYHKNQQQPQNAPFSSYQSYHQQSQTAPFSSYHNNQQRSPTAPFSSYQTYHQQSQTAPFSSYHSDQQQQYSSTQYQR